MTGEERIANLKAMGYTDSEAEFLCLAALHSGYFVRRQFLAYIDRLTGWADTALAEKVVRNGHCKQHVFRHNRSVYSFCSKPFFEVLGEPDNRNRRLHEVFTMKNRLMSLDFIIQNRSCRFLATEAERVGHFCQRMGLNIAVLPSKVYPAMAGTGSTTRYFVDKYPIYIDVPQSGAEELAHFCYVDEGQHGMSRFRNYLDQYARMFAGLPQFRLVYVSCFESRFKAAQSIFEKAVNADDECVPDGHSMLRVLEHFRDRAAYENGDFERFDQNRLIRFRRDRSAFAAPKYDALFAEWKRSGDEIVSEQSSSDMGPGRASSWFCAYRLPFRYEFFGTLLTRGSDTERSAS
jgi:hypothetical protein